MSVTSRFLGLLRWCLPAWRWLISPGSSTIAQETDGSLTGTWKLVVLAFGDG